VVVEDAKALLVFFCLFLQFFAEDGTEEFAGGFEIEDWGELVAKLDY